jgi:hypothetical protein
MSPSLRIQDLEKTVRACAILNGMARSLPVAKNQLPSMRRSAKLVATTSERSGGAQLESQVGSV